MTISSLLGRGVTPASRFQMTGQSAMGDAEVFHHVDRGSYGHGGGGGKGGGKGQQSAMSALTLLAFLFFINLLQNCLKDSMMTNGSAMLMMMAANRSARHVRSLVEAVGTEDPEINALPGPGVHWDSNVLIRKKGDLGNEDFPSDQDLPGNDHTVYTTEGDVENSLWHETIDESSMGEMDYDDYQEQNSNNSLPKSSEFSKEDDLASSGHTSTNNVKFLHKELKIPLPNQQENLMMKSKNTEDSQHTSMKNANSLLHKELKVSEQEWPHQQEIPTSLNVADTTVINQNLRTNGYYQYYSNSDISDRDDWDYYGEEDNDGHEPRVESEDFVWRHLSTSNPNADGFVRDRYETEYPEDGSFSSSIGEYVSRIISSVSIPVIQRLKINFNIAQCSELVVCEAHRLGRAWGTPGLLLASGFSELVLWMYGSDDDHRKLIMEAATTGRERHSCRVQMQQCEDKSRDRSALPFMATILEQMV